MNKLSTDVRKIDEMANSGNYKKALEMLNSLLKKNPDHRVLISRRQKFEKELETLKRIQALEKKFRV